MRPQGFYGTELFLLHKAQTEGGSSGGAVLHEINNRLVLVAMHNAGTELKKPTKSGDVGVNVATLITAILNHISNPQSVQLPSDLQNKGIDLE